MWCIVYVVQCVIFECRVCTVLVCVICILCASVCELSMISGATHAQQLHVDGYISKKNDGLICDLVYNGTSL